MTDVAIDGGAAAPAEVTGAPIDADVASHSNPLGAQTPVAEKPVEAEVKAEPKPSATVSEAIARANEKVKAKAAEVKPDAAKTDAKPVEAKQEAKVEPKAEPLRSEKGQFAAKEPVKPVLTPEQQNSPHREAPARFTPDAKEAWATAPEPIKAEVHRAIRELEQGHQKYKADAEAFNEVREYHELAKSHGTTVKGALDHYWGIEQLLRKDWQAGFERIVANMQLRTPDGRQATFRDLAASALGQSPEEQAGRQDSIIQELRAELAGMKQQLGGVTQTIQKQHESATLDHVTKFAADHPRFDELADAIKEEIAHGYDLETAYTRAERLNPAAQKAVSEQPVIPASPAPLNPAGSKSISGAPSSGSDPASTTKGNKQVPSIEQALKRALARSAA